MRELKFRAWTDAEIMRYDIIPVDDRVAIDLKSPSFEQIWEEFDYMQWTGLKDIKGVDIYEGDIIKIDWKNKVNDNHLYNYESGIVKYIEGGFYCVKNKVYSNFGIKFILTNNRCINNLEVIGNIYQNPELCEN